MKTCLGCMTSLAQALLAGAALSVWAAAPSPAQAAVAPQLKLHPGIYHSKTNIRDPKNLADTCTTTIRFSGTISESAYYKKWVELWELPRYKHGKAKFPKRSRAAKINLITTANNFELFYKLESKTATSDSFGGEIKGHHCYQAVNTYLSISH